MDSPVQVLYIAGSGHSGSTFTDVFLDNHPSVVGVGELTNLVRGGYIEGRYCACGRPPAECPFWSDVRTEWAGRSGVDLVSYARLQHTFERYATWPRVVIERYRRSPAFATYAEWTVGLYQAIRRVSGRPLVVDSSKVPTRAAALALMPGVDLRLLHLIRDGRGVVFSVQKPKPFRADMPGRQIVPPPVWRTAVFWVIVNLQASTVRQRLAASQSLRLRYEDMMADFPAAMSRLGRVIGVELDELARRVAAGQELRVGHTIEGNRLRMVPVVRLRPDYEWMDRLPLRDRRLVWRLAAPWLRSYGYRADGSLGRDEGSPALTGRLPTADERGAKA